MNYVATFTDGTTSPVKVCGSFGGMLIGVAERGDHFMRAVFFTDAGQHDVDPWIKSVTAIEEQPSLTDHEFDRLFDDGPRVVPRERAAEDVERKLEELRR